MRLTSSAVNVNRVATIGVTIRPLRSLTGNHLLRERNALFTFLNCPGLESTNWRAEQAIRPMVVARKVWGGNRTARGAQTQSILVNSLTNLPPAVAACIHASPESALFLSAQNPGFSPLLRAKQLPSVTTIFPLSSMVPPGVKCSSSFL
jgi:hypothetical protein